MIELVNVTKKYRVGIHEITALDSVSLKIEDGEFVAIMGPSGSGKSTLLYLIGCLDRPTSGKVLIDGMNTSELSDAELTELRRNKIGFIFQQYYLIPTLTALENVELPMVFKNVSREDREKKAEELLALVGLEDKKERRPNELSGGEQQRVAIARALANDPSILLCDEPTGNLDTRSGEVVMNIIKNLNVQRGVTVVLVTHNPMLSKYADRIIKLRDGRIVYAD